jgi:hypothetical protein
MEMRKSIIKILERADEIKQNLVSNLTEEERSMSGDYDHWSIKDHVAHCAAWMDRLAREISVAMEGITHTSSRIQQAILGGDFGLFNGSQIRIDWGRPDRL